MNPRRQTKQKWTPFPTELSEQIRQIFKQNFGTQLSNTTKVNILGKIFTQELCLRVGLHKKGELKHQNFEVSVDHNGHHENVVSQIHVCVDALAGLVQEFFDNEEGAELPYTWTEFPFKKQIIYVQMSRENPDLEAQANALLGESNDGGLVNEYEGATEIEGEGEISKELAEELSKDPTMFSGRKKKKKEDLH